MEQNTDNKTDLTYAIEVLKNSQFAVMQKVNDLLTFYRENNCTCNGTGKCEVCKAELAIAQVAAIINSTAEELDVRIPDSISDRPELNSFVPGKSSVPSHILIDLLKKRGWSITDIGDSRYALVDSSRKETDIILHSEKLELYNSEVLGKYGTVSFELKQCYYYFTESPSRLVITGKDNTGFHLVL